MPLVTQKLKPGFDSLSTQTENAGGWFDGNLLRWRLGHLEKYPGWERLIDQNCGEHVRVLHAWEDLELNSNLLIGTDAGPLLLVNLTLFTMETTSGFVFSCTTADTIFSVNAGDSTATAHRVGADAQVGGIVTAQQRLSIGGVIIPAGLVMQVTNAFSGGFSFALPSAALYTELGTPGASRFLIAQFNALTNVVFKNHGQSPGSVFTVDQTTKLSAPNSLTIPAGAQLVVVSVIDVNTFTFDRTPFGGTIVLDEAIYEGTNGTAVPETFGLTLEYGNPVRGAANTWFADNLGEDGLMCFSTSPIFLYTPPITSGTVLTAIGGGTTPTAPQLNTGMFTAMPQAQVIAFGTEPVFGDGTIDPLLLRWSDAGSFDVWTATVSNQAGSYRLSRGSKIVGGVQAPQTTLIFTDTDAWSMSYIGTPLIYGFTIVGSGCGLVAPHAVGVLGRNTYWQSTNGFWKVGDTGAQPLPCPLWDTIFRDLDVANIDKCHVAVNSSANEVAFWYPSLTDGAKLVFPLNLLAWSQRLQNPPWTPNSVRTTVITIGTFLAPDGSNTSQKVREGTDIALHSVFQRINKSASAIAYTASIYAHSSSTRLLQLNMSSNLGSVSVVFDPRDGSLVTSSQTGGMALANAFSTTDALAQGISILTTEAGDDLITEDGLDTIAGDGWLRYVVQFTSDTEPFFNFEVINNSDSVTDVYLGDGMSGVVVWGAMVNVGDLIDYVATSAPVTNECTRYVKYNTLENLWDPGFGITRTAWLDNNIYGTPLGADENFLIQQHERGFDNDGQPMRNVFAETGYVGIQDGTIIPMIDQCQPDFKWFGLNGGVKITLKGLNYPGGEPVNYGPYSTTPTTQFFSPRVRAKRIAIRYDWEPLLGFSARVGAMTFRTKPAGRRP